MAKPSREKKILRVRLFLIAIRPHYQDELNLRVVSDSAPGAKNTLEFSH